MLKIQYIEHVNLCLIFHLITGRSSSLTTVYLNTTAVLNYSDTRTQQLVSSRSPPPFFAHGGLNDKTFIMCFGEERRVDCVFWEKMSC